MDLSSSIYLFLKNNITVNKSRRSSDTVLSNSTYKMDQDLNIKCLNIKNMKKTLFEKDNESFISRNSLFYSHDSLSGQNQDVILDKNDEMLSKENNDIKTKKENKCFEKSSVNQTSQLIDNIIPGNFFLSKSSILPVYNTITSENSLQVPNLEATCKLPFKLKSNVNSRKTSLIENKQSRRRFKSAPNSRQKKDQPAVFSISAKEKKNNSTFRCKVCNSENNVLKSTENDL